MTEDGVTIEFMSQGKLTDHSFDSKLDLVLEKVRDDSVLVLEEGWKPEEKRQLIQTAVEEADEDFPGVEFMGLNSENSRLDKAKDLVYQKILNEERRSGLTIVGNARVMEKIKEERDTVSFLAKLETGES
ncbi:MAG: DUF2073 domain-containing protein [Candidatus Nanohaloarchaea archaeon]